MIAMPIYPDWRRYADDVREEFGSRSINGEGLDGYIGTYGELAFGRLLRENGTPFNYVAREKKTWDFEVNGEKVDVKTQRASVPPSREWYATIMKEQCLHECDRYVFAVLQWPVDQQIHKIHFVSTVKKDAFFRHPDLVRAKKGDAVVSMTVSRDCFMLPHNNMEDTEVYLWWQT